MRCPSLLRLFPLSLIAAALFSAIPVFAACTNPAANAGDIQYSAAQGIMAYCNGSNWVAMGSQSTTTFGTLTTNDFCTATSGTAIQCTTAYTGSGDVVLATSPHLTGPIVDSGGLTITAGGITVAAGGANITGTVTGTTFSGSGASLTSIGTTNMTAVTGTPSNTTFLRGDNTWSAVSLGTGSITGVVTVPQGGTGDTTLTAHGLMVGNGTNPVSVTAAGATNTVLVGNGASADPSFSASPTLTNLTLTGYQTLSFGTDHSTTGAQADVAINGSSTVRYTGAGTATFYGIVAGNSGQLLYLHNDSSSTLTLSNLSGSESTAANQIITGIGSDMSVLANAVVTLQYDSSANSGNGAWRVTGSSQSATAQAAGSTGQVQFNGGTYLAADSNFHWDNTNKRLGIGTALPGYSLEVTGNVRADTSFNAPIYVAGWGGAGGRYVSYGVGTTNGPGIFFPSGTALAIATNSTERVRVDSSGNVGIGTTAPQALGHIYQSSNAAGALNIGVSGTGASQEADLNLITYQGWNSATQTSATHWWQLQATGAGTGNEFLNINYWDGSALSQMAHFASYGVELQGMTDMRLDDTTVYAPTSASSDVPIVGQAAAQNGSMVDGSIGMLNLWTFNSSGNGQHVYLGAVSNAGAAVYSPEFVIGQTTGGSAYAERMRINSSGNVGIGTTGPASLLHLYSSTSWTGGVTVQGGGSGTGDGVNGLQIINNAGYQYNLALGSSGNTLACGSNSLCVWDNNAGAVRFDINSSGNVGIGTATPQSLVHAYGGEVEVGSSGNACNALRGGAIRFSGSTLYYCDGSSAWQSVSSSATLGTSMPAAGSTGYVQFNTSNLLNADSNLFWDNANKRLGIGTTGPTQTLDVNGSVSVRGAYIYQNTSNGSGAVNGTGGPLIYADANNTVVKMGSSNGALLVQNYSGTTEVALATNNNSYFIGGNVGINTTSPSNRLMVESARQATASTANAAAKIGGNDVYTYIGSYSGSPWGTWIQTMRPSDDATFPLSLNPNDGNVGIGTTSPVYKLDVSGSLNATNYIWKGGVNWSMPDDNTEMSFDFANGNGNAYWQVWDPTHSTILAVRNNGNVGIRTSSPSWPLTVYTASSSYGLVQTDGTRSVGTYVDGSGGWFGTNSNHNLNFFTNSGSAQITLTTGGNVGINTTSPSNKLDVYSGTGQNAIVGYGDADGSHYGVIGYSGPAYGALGRSDGWALVGNGSTWISGTYQSSDARLKEEVHPLEKQLNVIEKLRPVSFKWKKDTEEYATARSALQLGLIAQEVQKVLPEVIASIKRPGSPVGGKPTLDDKLGEVYGVDYVKIVPVLIGAVQELKADNDSLRIELKAANDNHAADEARLKKLEDQLTALTAAGGRKR